MTNPILYEQLDAAIGVMLSEPDAAVQADDPEVRELLAIAAELRSTARPEFRAALESELRHELGLPLRKPEEQPFAVLPKTAPEAELPALFAANAATYPVRGRNFAFSLTAHAAALALVLFSSFAVVKNVSSVRRNVVVTIGEPSEYPLPVGNSKGGGGGGGGDNDKLNASLGRLPEQSMQQLAPPTAVIRNPNPALVVEPTVVVPPDVRIPQPSVAQFGDPLARLDGPPSNGPGTGGGIGDGTGTGVGSGEGFGVGRGFGWGFGGGAFKVGGGVSAPKAIYAPDPEFSEEARKAKYQGTVGLWVVIGPDGRVRDMKVVRSLGMGLDQKAVEAVRNWRFDPARKNGQPVPVQVNIEVNFRLY